MKKAKHAKASKALAVVPTAPKPEPMAIALTPIHLKAAIAFRDRAAMIVVSDKASDEGALATILDGKKLKRTVLADWQIPKRKVSGVLDALRGLEKAEIEAIDVGLDGLDKRHFDYANAVEARAVEVERQNRERSEAQARKDRDAELATQERAAAKLEASSPDLSAREQKFVDVIVQGRGTALDLPQLPELAASRAGYVDPKTKGPALLDVPKIKKAIATAIEVKARREQTAALREEPIAVTTTKVEREIGRVPGARNTKHYSCEGVVDLEKFRAAYLAGEIPAEAMTPDLKFLNRMAESLKEKFEQAYPGCRLKIDQGVAG